MLNFGRPLWALCWAVISGACYFGYLRKIDGFFAHRWWTPATRLTYGAYLCHPIVIKLFAGRLVLLCCARHHEDPLLGSSLKNRWVGFSNYFYTGAGPRPHKLSCGDWTVNPRHQELFVKNCTADIVCTVNEEFLMVIVLVRIFVPLS